MTIPKAPSWTAVFLFGILYNAVIVRSVYGAIACAGIGLYAALIVRFVDWLVPLPLRRARPDSQAREGER